jgi:hypothetical protein
MLRPLNQATTYAVSLSDISKKYRMPTRQVRYVFENGDIPARTFITEGVGRQRRLTQYGEFLTVLMGRLLLFGVRRSLAKAVIHRLDHLTVGRADNRMPFETALANYDCKITIGDGVWLSVALHRPGDEPEDKLLPEWWGESVTISTGKLVANKNPLVSISVLSSKLLQPAGP